MKAIRMVFILSAFAVFIFNTSIGINRKSNINLEVLRKIAIANAEEFCAKNVNDYILNCKVIKVTTPNTFLWQYNPSTCESNCEPGAGVNCCYELEIIYAK